MPQHIPLRKWSFGSNTSAPRVTSRISDQARAAMAQLHAQYAGYRDEGMGRRVAPWTREAAVALGKLFVAAHGRIPPAAYLQAAYSMPEESSVRRLFGTLDQYRAALSQEARDAI